MIIIRYLFVLPDAHTESHLGIWRVISCCCCSCVGTRAHWFSCMSHEAQTRSPDRYSSGTRPVQRFNVSAASVMVRPDGLLSQWSTMTCGTVTLSCFVHWARRLKLRRVSWKERTVIDGGAWGLVAACSMGLWILIKWLWKFYETAWARWL